MSSAELDLVTKLWRLINRAIELMEQRGPSGQRLYDAPAEEWRYDVEALRDEDPEAVLEEE